MSSTIPDMASTSDEHAPAAPKDRAHRRSWLQRIARPPAADREDAASRLSAYVYGNIITLAALTTVSHEAMENGRGFLVVLGVALSTYLIHVFADCIGRRVRSDASLKRHELVEEARNSVPVFSSAAVPAVVLAASWLLHVSPLLAQIVAGAYLVVRLGLIGVIMARLRGQPSSLRVILSGVALAFFALLLTVMKIYLSH